MNNRTYLLNDIFNKINLSHKYKYVYTYESSCIPLSQLQFLLLWNIQHFIPLACVNIVRKDSFYDKLASSLISNFFLTNKDSPPWHNIKIMAISTCNIKSNLPKNILCKIKNALSGDPEVIPNARAHILLIFFSIKSSFISARSPTISL